MAILGDFKLVHIQIGLVQYVFTAYPIKCLQLPRLFEVEILGYVGNM